LFWGEGEGTVSTQAPDLEADFIHWERVTQDGLVVIRRTYFRIGN
jgi:hypothetical protein